MTLQFRCRVIFFVPHRTVWAMCVARYVQTAEIPRRTDITVIPLADFALIRRFAPPSPPGGRLRSVVQHFQAIPLSHTYKSALSLTMRDCRSSLPPGGEGGAPAPDEGETGERTHARHLSAFLPLFHKPLHLIRGVRNPRGAVGKEE